MSRQDAGNTFFAKLPNDKNSVQIFYEQALKIYAECRQAIQL
jgi:hypothetical protein